MISEDHDSDPSGTMRDRIILAAAAIIAAEGPEAATTRAVSAAAGVQAPAIYRIFGDKRGLMEAVTRDGFARYIAEKSIRKPHADPVENLRNGWDVHVEFGLTHPGLYTVMSTQTGPRDPSPAAAAGDRLLRRHVGAIAQAGRLRVSEDRAVALIYAACTGTILALLRLPKAQRNGMLSIDAREAVMAAITTDVPDAPASEKTAAITLRASLEEGAILTAGERMLLHELLDRISAD